MMEDTLYKSIVDNTPVAILVLRNDHILQANVAACSLFEYTASEMIVNGLPAITKEYQQLTITALLNTQFKHKEGIVLQATKKNGAILYIRCYPTLLKQDADTIVSLFITDITNEYINETQLDLLINNTREPFMVLDKELRITFFNKQFYNICRYYLKLDIRTGISVVDLALVANQEAVINRYQRVLQGSIEKSYNMVPFSEQVIKRFESTYIPIWNDQDEISGVFIAACC